MHYRGAPAAGAGAGVARHMPSSVFRMCNQGEQRSASHYIGVMASHVDEEEKSGKALDDWIDEAVAAGKGWSDEERDRYLQGLRDSEYELPLFADSVDEMDPDIVSGLQELRDEEPPDILAEAAKARGNESFKTAVTVRNRVYYREALKQYSDAIAFAKKATENELDVECTSRMRQLQSIAHANCAACNLALKNYGLVKRDCRHALEFDSGNLKACYRLAKVGGSASAASRGVTNFSSVPGKPCAEAA